MRAGATPSGWLYESETQLDSQVEGSVELEFWAQHGSAVKAAFSLVRFCPMESMARFLAIV